MYQVIKAIKRLVGLLKTENIQMIGSFRLGKVHIATLWPQPNCPGQCQTWLSQLGPRSGIIITLYLHPRYVAAAPPDMWLLLTGAHVWIDYISAISQQIELKICMMNL